tara:strand:- start:190 stop:699 length:510 start_codon:yes stop_codon:yes gene_type:complete
MYKKVLDCIKNIFNNYFEVSIIVSSILIIVIAAFIDWYFFLMACPMCILTRYVFGLVAISGLISLILKRKYFGYILIIISSVIGLLVTLRQIYIQNMSPEQIAQLAGSCSRPFHISVEYEGIITTIKETLEGGPSCAEDGMRILFNFAEWAFIFFFVYLVFTVLKTKKG